MNTEERIRQVDLAVVSATVSLLGLTVEEIDLAKRLCQHFDLKLGTLIRRTAAIEITGGADSVSDRLREAAQHLIYD